LALTDLQFLYVGLAAFLVGFSKTSVGGVGILAVLLMALAFPGKASPGVLLPMLIMADIIAVIYYRRACQWRILVRMFPLTAFGVVLGYLLTDIIPPDVFARIIGLLILSMLGLEILVRQPGVLRHLHGWFWTAFVGSIAGVATMVANAAGPVFGVYLLQMGLTKQEFVGTRSWFFLLLNIFKIPFSASLGLITTETLKLNLVSFPVILTGAALGYVFLKYINLTVFKWLIRAAVLVAATRLILF
jgi:uncharacterized protein